MKCQEIVFATGKWCEHKAKYKAFVVTPAWREWLFVCGIHARGIPKDRRVKLENESK